MSKGGHSGGKGKPQAGYCEARTQQPELMSTAVVLSDVAYFIQDVLASHDVLDGIHHLLRLALELGPRADAWPNDALILLKVLDLAEQASLSNMRR